MIAGDVAQWGKEFREQPKVWYVAVYFEGVNEDTGNFYDCEEAANIEAAWRCARRQKASVFSANLHSLDLSRRRWPAP